MPNKLFTSTHIQSTLERIRKCVVCKRQHGSDIFQLPKIEVKQAEDCGRIMMDVGRKRRSLGGLQNPFVPQTMLCFSLLFPQELSCPPHGSAPHCSILSHSFSDTINGFFFSLIFHFLASQLNWGERENQHSEQEALRIKRGRPMFESEMQTATWCHLVLFRLEFSRSISPK